jgi:deoxyadenosine/deoxycytidine kinase
MPVGTVDEMRALWLSATSRLPASPLRRRGSVVVELVGPAGAGKTTLRRVLAQRVTSARVGVRVDRRRDFPAGAMSALSLIPEFGACALNGRPTLAWQSTVQLVRLDALHRSVRRAAASHAGPVILDEGAVFAFTKLRLLAQGLEVDPMAERVHKALERWRRTLDVIVWIDAADEVLTTRIRARPKAHRVKEESEVEIAKFLAGYRVAYGQVLSKLAAHGGPLVLRFETGSEPVDALATRVLSVLHIPDHRWS